MIVSNIDFEKIPYLKSMRAGVWVMEKVRVKQYR